MYLGIILAAVGGLLTYRTWTFLFVVISFLGLALRARQKEGALAAEFGMATPPNPRRAPFFR